MVFSRRDHLVPNRLLTCDEKKSSVCGVVEKSKGKKISLKGESSLVSVAKYLYGWRKKKSEAGDVLKCQSFFLTTKSGQLPTYHTRHCKIIRHT